jgi:hypothetical protein
VILAVGINSMRSDGGRVVLRAFPTVPVGPEVMNVLSDADSVTPGAGDDVIAAGIAGSHVFCNPQVRPMSFDRWAAIAGTTGCPVIVPANGGNRECIGGHGVYTIHDSSEVAMAVSVTASIMMIEDNLRKKNLDVEGLARVAQGAYSAEKCEAEWETFRGFLSFAEVETPSDWRIKA